MFCDFESPFNASQIFVPSDPVYTNTDPSGSVPKLVQIGIPFTLELLDPCSLRSAICILVWNRFPRCSHLAPFRFRSSANCWSRSKQVHFVFEPWQFLVSSRNEETLAKTQQQWDGSGWSRPSVDAI